AGAAAAVEAMTAAVALADSAVEAPAAVAPEAIGKITKAPEICGAEETGTMMRRGLWIAIGVVVVIFLIILMVFGSYVSAKNQMVAKQEAVKSQWSQVDVVLQRRADLIPNLVSTV